MKKRALALVLTLFIVALLVPPVHAAEPILTEDGEDATKISVFEGATRIAIKSSEYQFPGADVHTLYTTKRANIAYALNNTSYLLTGNLGLYPGQTIEATLNRELKGGISTMAYASAIDLMEKTPSQNIGGYYANMLLPKSITGNGTSVYADDCTTASPLPKNATPTPTPSGGSDNPLTVPPACKSTFDYWNEFGIGKLWTVTFTLAMAFVVLILVSAGFMIMFRQKAGGQQIVSITMALQNVLIGTALALASFGLGAFFMNFSKFLTLIIADMFNSVLWSDFNTAQLTEWIGFKSETANTYISNPLGIFSKFIFISLYGDFMANPKDLGLLQGLISGGAPAFSTTGSAIKLWFWDHAPDLMFWLKSPFYLIGRIIGAGFLLWYSIRIWFETVKIFLFMMGDTILAPITFVLGSIPGVWKGKSVSDWFTRMLRNSLKVPAMFALVNVAGYVTISLAMSGGTAQENPLTALSGGYYGAADWSVSEVVTSFGGFLTSAIGPNFIAFLAILSFVPLVPAFLDEMLPVSQGGAVSDTLSSFGTILATTNLKKTISKPVASFTEGFKTDPDKRK